MLARTARTPRLLALLAVALLGSIPSARGELVLSTTNPAVTSGSSGDSLDVLLTNTGPSAVTIEGFSFGLQAGSTAVTFTDATTATAAPNTYIFSGNSLFGPDIVISTGSNPSTILAGDNFGTQDQGVSVAANSTVGLGHVLFNVAVGAPNSITVNFQPFPDTGLNSPFMQNLNNLDYTTTPGTITVTAVPEPSTFALAGMLGACLGTRHVWRRRARTRAAGA